MKKQKVFYDKKSDALWLRIKSGVEYDAKEVAPGVNVELGKNGDLLGVEILNASKVLAKKLVKPANGKAQNYTAAIGQTILR